MKHRRPQRAHRDPRAMLDAGPTYSRRTWPRHRREQQRAGIVPASLLYECQALGMDPHDLRRDFCHAARVCDFERNRTHPDGWHFIERTLAIAMCWYVQGRVHQARPAHERPAAEAAARE